MSTPKLSDFFSTAPLPSHGPKWSSLWSQSYTPWDRGGPSLALHDLLLSRPDLVPPAANLLAASPGGSLPLALVPGCGRGHDALFLSAMGYRVIGLDYAPDATREAIANEAAVSLAMEAGSPDVAVYRTREGAVRGTVTWVTGDFFENTWLSDAGLDTNTTFDLIYDYTFLCALPPSARPLWASRMSSLLAHHTGRLVCLEFPSGKPPAELGPPWGLTSDIYIALLAQPGQDIPPDVDASSVSIDPAKGLTRLERIKPVRTHKAGTNDDGSVRDWLHVWQHVSP
ncbi:thiopurine S-methyltransferase family protein [Plectosphaerella cucumerina]|uniref:Thiopurine S-methyltransferase family protein n=1 Tax=Plectosphaerella cucumerina TaxID=40658 RepID=A0A8K0X0X9_9PEZI|nr:thiopurine S-methyltransferase family protein [Plectosphaerella cucumerina]